MALARSLAGFSGLPGHFSLRDDMQSSLLDLLQLMDWLPAAPQAASCVMPSGCPTSSLALWYLDLAPAAHCRSLFLAPDLSDAVSPPV